MFKILIVEDDISLNNGILLSLKQSDYLLKQAFTYEEALSEVTDSSYSLFILDICLPDGNGFDICKKIRETSRVPILFLTANDMELDIVTGLELGADDYMTKPFSLMVLRARVNALLRRSGETDRHTIYQIDDFLFDFPEMHFSKAGKEIILSRTEQRLLRLLVEHQGTVLSRSALIDRIWADGAEYVDENALSVCISRLRNKLEKNPSKPNYIQTVYGIGYAWRPEKND